MLSYELAGELQHTSDILHKGILKLFLLLGMPEDKRRKNKQQRWNRDCSNKKAEQEEETKTKMKTKTTLLTS